ncbi:MAG: ATP-dependent helicase [Methanobacteriota archaeon]|nr:MAG: ATP-dependent helicase [Euryarchaeota archaeon]
MTPGVQVEHTTDETLSLLHPVIADWFRAKYDEVTEAQSMAVPIIHRRESVLVSSPTGSGKTLTAFLSIINELALLASDGKLEDNVYAVYVSPLKALANDINENLLTPLHEISSRFEAMGLEAPGIRVAVRTGDTLQSERQKQARRPPHIFITTPESLSLVLSTPVFRKRFETVQYVIVDETHEICDSKRGVALSIALERLQRLCPNQLVRIGLSATVAPVEEVADFLAGVENGTARPMKVVEVFGQRSLDMKVICPTDDMTSLSFEVVNSKMYDMLKGMVEGHRTTLVFTNTRSGTESVVYKLKERGIERIGAHHGSLSRETRLDVEGELRGGSLRAVVSSTSLELGIDIGSIDLVVQIGSPKSVAKGLQRIGRAGHQYGGTSKGRIVVFESDDLVECAVLSRAAHRKAIDRVTIPAKSLDVLSQAVVALSIEQKWKVADALELFRRSYCYRDLTRDELVSVLNYLGGKDDFEGVYSKIWYDPDEGVFGRKRGARMIYYLNQGTIPEEADFKVFSERGAFVGSLSEKFVERLSKGDIFVLGGRSYEFLKSKGMKSFVRSATGKKPTVPSWTGEMLPRSFDLSVMVGEFREEMRERLEGDVDADLKGWLMREFHVDGGSATTMINYFQEQRSVGKIPTNSRLLVEGYVDQSGNRSAIFHFPFGRRVNDALSRAYASALAEQVGANVAVSISDDCFMLTAPGPFDLKRLTGAVTAATLEDRLRNAVSDSELFAQRFRHVATRSFMVLRNYKGKELSVGRQQLRSQRLLEALHELKGFPVLVETYSEILTEVMDMENAAGVLRSVEEGDRTIDFLPFSTVPSPFAHNIILLGVSDVVLMEDKSMLLRNLHRKVVERALGKGASVAGQFDSLAVDEYFKRKGPRIDSPEEMLEAVRRVGPMNLFREKGESAYSRSAQPFEKVRSWASSLLRKGEVRSVWVGEDVYVHSDQHSTYLGIHRRSVDLTPADKRILKALVRSPKGVRPTAEEAGVDEGVTRRRIRRMEMANIVFRCGLRGGAPIYSASPESDRDRSACVSEALARHLAYHAPISLEDLAYEVGVQEEEAKRALDQLIAQNTVVSGQFSAGDRTEYLLVSDYLQLSSEGERIFDWDAVNSYRRRRQLGQLESIEDYFHRFGSAGMAYDLIHRVKDFDIQDFYEFRREGRILLGRFVRGRVRYILAEDAPYYLSVFGEGRLTKFESAIAKALESLGEGTYLEIAEHLGMPSAVMREAFDSLDRKGYLLRKFDEAEHWSSRNVYSLSTIKPVEEGALAKVAEHQLRGHGPMSLSQVASFLKVGEQTARAVLSEIDAVKIKAGLERVELFVLASDLKELETSVAAGEIDSIRILSLYDPFLSDRWPEVAAAYGEGWIYPIVLGDALVGMVESWLMAGAVDIRDVQLRDEAHLGGVVEALIRSMSFYNMLGIDILRVRSALGKEVCDLEDDVKAEFLSRGFHESNGMMVHGHLVTDCHSREEMLAVMFSLQNLSASDRLHSMEDALARYGGIRSDVEALIRVRRSEPLSIMHKRGVVVRGYLVPDRVGYCLPTDASVYRSARQRELTEDESYLLRIVGDRRAAKKDKLLSLSPVGPERTVEAIKRLYHHSHLYVDSSHSYVIAKKRRLRREGVWLTILERMFDLYGIVTAETLSLLLGRDLRMRDIRRMLRVLEGRGDVVKGHLMRGSSTIYWATKKAHTMIGRARIDGDIVLSPEDNLYQFLRAAFRDLMPRGGRFAVFKGSALVGSFSGKMREGALEVNDLDGGLEVTRIVDQYAKMIGRRMRGGGEIGTTDWEIMEFYEKSHPGI